MKKALLVGIDNYEQAPLSGCVNDATRIGALLERHDDGSRNFFCQYLLSSQQSVTTPRLMEVLEQLLNQPADQALFYFAGHGFASNLGGHMVTQKARKHEVGINLDQLLQLANASQVKEIILIIDACHSGHIGNMGLEGQVTLREGIAIMCSSRGGQLSQEKNGRGIFSQELERALAGGAADELGRVSLTQVYSSIDNNLNPWQQRPLFKANMTRSIYLRRCFSSLTHELIRKLPEYFPDPDDLYPLSPAYEPSLEPRNLQLEAIFHDFQILRSKGLLEPVDAPHLYYAALHSKACRLTHLGKMFHQMGNNGLL